MRYTLRAALLCLACAAPALASMSATAQESHVNTARDLAANCANCHGTDGHAIAGMSSLEIGRAHV